MTEPITNLTDAVAALGALPMPVGPEPQTDADRAKAPWGRGEDGRPILPMGAHWTDIPELVDQTLADIKARVDQAQPGNWYVSPTAEAPDTVCTRYDGYTRAVGRFTNALPGDLGLVLHAHSDLRWCLEMIAKLRGRVSQLEAQRKADHETWQHDLRTARGEREATAARIAELESERHSTNEALSDAAERMRADRDRIAELERQLADAPLPVTLTAKAEESADKLTALIAPNACPSNVIDGDQGGHFFKKGAFKDSPIACRYCGMKRPEFGGVS